MADGFAISEIGTSGKVLTPEARDRGDVKGGSVLGDRAVKGKRVTSIDGGLRHLTGSSAERNRNKVGIIIIHRGVLDEGIEHSLVGAKKLLRSRNKIRNTLQRRVEWSSSRT